MSEIATGDMSIRTSAFQNDGLRSGELSVGIKYDFGRTGERHDLDLSKLHDNTYRSTIELLTATYFSQPELWHKPTRPFEYTFGTGHPIDPEWGEGYEDESRLIIKYPLETWFANVYGFRIVPDTQNDYAEDVQIEEVDIATITKIHEAIASNVLINEHTRIAIPIIPPFPEEGYSNPKNNDLWLEMIRDGKWPIMKDSIDKVTGEVKFNTHDSSAQHLGNLATFPRELQDIITETTVHELAWRKKYYNKEVEEKMLLLPGENSSDNDPFFSGAGLNPMHTDGIGKIDLLTDTHHYIDILNYLKEHKNASLDTLLEIEEDSALGKRLTGMKRLIGDIVNYNTRHREGRNTNQEEINTANEAFLKGTIRVAGKIRGDYDLAA